MDLVLVMENAQAAPLLWCGVSGREIGKLGPNSAKLVELNIIAVATGLQVSPYIVKEQISSLSLMSALKSI